MNAVPAPASASPGSTRRPRLLIASVTYVVEENRKKLAALAAEGFDLICATPESIQSFGLTAQVREQPVPTDYRLVPLPAFGDVPSGTRFGLRGLGKLLKETQPDVVLAEAEPWALLRWQLWWAHRRHCPRALFGEFTWENLRRPGWKGRVLAAVYRAAVRTGDFAVAGNQEAGAILRDAGLHPNRLLVAPQMGVDETGFTPADSPGERRAARVAAGLPPDALLVGFCGRLEAMKGVPELVAAIERLRAEGNPTRDVHLALLGEGSLRAGLPVADWLHVLPPRPHAAVGGFLRLLDLFILPSRTWQQGGTVWKEQFGHVLIEAMACGVPCVGSDSGAIPEVIGDPDHIFPEGDPDALTALLRRKLANIAALARAGVQQRERALGTYTNAAVARVWGNFLRRRLTAEQRSVLWVDPNLTLSSPSTKHLLYSTPHLLAEGWELRAWCVGPTPDLPEAVEVSRLRPLPLLRGPLSLWNFFLVANARGGFDRILRGRPPAGIVHTMGGLYLGADVSSTHFVNAVWLRRQWELGVHGGRELAAAVLTVGGALMDGWQFRNRRCRLFLPVSDSIAREVRARCHPGAEVVTLPNSYDETRFNPSVRARWRETMRAELGFDARDVVFAFVSQGHHRRKGFWLAVEALRQLRATLAATANGGETPAVRFLAVGGRPGTLSGLRANLDRVAPDWQDWVHLAGPQPEVGRYLSAADAFLFPSYFEAFCLAEIEATALGLPLLLTPHHGSEMVLRDGVNGRFLSFDPEVMAGQIGEFLNGPRPDGSNLASGAVTRADYAQRLGRLYQRRSDEVDESASSFTGASSSMVESSSSQEDMESRDTGKPDPLTTV